LPLLGAPAGSSSGERLRPGLATSGVRPPLVVVCFFFTISVPEFAIPIATADVPPQANRYYSETVDGFATRLPQVLFFLRSPTVFILSSQCLRSPCFWSGSPKPLICSPRLLAILCSECPVPPPRSRFKPGFTLMLLQASGLSSVPSDVRK